MEGEFILDKEIERLIGQIEGNILILDGIRYKILRGEKEGLVVIKI